MQQFIPAGVCARQIDFLVENGIVRSVDFKGGCPGNLIGIKHLVEGMSVQDAIQKLAGIRCGDKTTSCPDQLAQALQHTLS